jgi:hypothetical protein
MLGLTDDEYNDPCCGCGCEDDEECQDCYDKLSSEKIIIVSERENEIYPDRHCEYCRYSGEHCTATDDTEKINDECLCRCNYFYPKDEFMNEYESN